jgi:4-hydroxymandelate oxidase
MTKWVCTVCGYVHEGDAPPERCPVCESPASAFEPLVDGAALSASSRLDTVPETLDDVRDRAREILSGVCGVFPACDGVADRMCQREAYGRPIGMGGAGSGSSFSANYQALAAKRFVTCLIGEHFVPNTEFEIFGRTLSAPILGSSVAGPGSFTEGMSELDFCKANVQGCLDAGTLALRGDTFFYTLDEHPSLDSIEAAGGSGIPIFKPRAQDVLLKLIERAQRMGCPAVGVDLDGCGSINMARAGQPVFRKTVSEMRELTGATDLPFIFKGIMSVADAESCVETGAAVVAVSNHGGRVQDHTPGVAEVLPAIASRVGDDVLVTADGGVRTGYDALKMLALGADAVLVGRDLVRAAIGGGAAGVRMQIDRLGAVLGHAMLMTGTRDLASIGPHVFYD